MNGLLQEIDRRMATMQIPSDLGRIPHKISENWQSFKADEWKHWTLIYSGYCLREILSTEEANVWSMFVSACRLLCKQCITHQENEQAHSLLNLFCHKFEELYGKYRILD